jgi:hypothetical protein
MQLAMYKGPPNGWKLQLAHRLICLKTKSIYSHCEILIDGVGYSSSNRDGGVRAKPTDLSTKHWDLFNVHADQDQVLQFFSRTKGQPYDTLGELHFALGFLAQDPDRWFCSEWCAAALGVGDPWTYSPQGLLNYCLANLKA